MLQDFGADLLLIICSPELSRKRTRSSSCSALWLLTLSRKTVIKANPTLEPLAVLMELSNSFPGGGGAQQPRPVSISLVKPSVPPARGTCFSALERVTPPLLGPLKSMERLSITSEGFGSAPESVAPLPATTRSRPESSSPPFPPTPKPLPRDSLCCFSLGFFEELSQFYF